MNNSIPEDMDLGEEFYQNLNGLSQIEDYNLEVLDGIDLSDLLASPSPYNGFPNEVNAMQEGSQEYHGNFQLNSAVQSPYNDPMFPVLSPSAPQAQAVHLSNDGGLHQSEMTDNNLSEIEPMRLGSEIEVIMKDDPAALQQSLKSIELSTSRNPSMTPSQPPSGSEMESQGQASPDSSQPQTTSTTPATGAAGNGEGYFADYRLPDYNHFTLSVKFFSRLMLEKKVTKGGCLLHYQPPDRPPIHSTADRDTIAIPTKIEQDGSMKEFPWANSKQKRFTEEMILKNFCRGVQFDTENGNIYATRRSNTKLFWLSTENSEITSAIELSRNKKTEIFNWEKFKRNLAVSLALGKADKLRLPAIWISFAQKWNRDSSTITTKLVWARIDPARACEMVKNVNPDVRTTEKEESLHTSLLAISNEPSQNAQD